MISQVLQFASEEPAGGGGLSALGLDVKGFFFQLIMFVAVLLIMRKFVYKQLVDTLEARRRTVIESIENAKQAADDLDQAEVRVEKLLAEARQESAEIVGIAHKEAVAMVEEAEAKAQKKAEHIVHEAKAQLEGEIRKARDLLQKETKQLVADATEQIIGHKLTGSADEKLIDKALQEAK